MIFLRYAAESCRSGEPRRLSSRPRHRLYPTSPWDRETANSTLRRSVVAQPDGDGPRCHRDRAANRPTSGCVPPRTQAQPVALPPPARQPSDKARENGLAAPQDRSRGHHRCRIVTLGPASPVAGSVSSAIKSRHGRCTRRTTFTGRCLGSLGCRFVAFP